ncbi:RodZ domain-containing protein [Salinicola tamaricis]|uniref:RodZ domain-containing protein n=1 Tax=Salinicola tamaricis TaxID=1771309 RepID=UPI000D0A8C42|nr:RodZ domain-containing protein [Salinicola tamaricis]
MSAIDEQQQESERSTHAESAGEMLRAERERQGLSLDEVALQLNLRPSVVEGLEQDNFEQVPIAAYRRGYVRAYARLLGMNERQVVSAYNAAHGQSDIERKLSPVNTTRPPSRVGAWIFRLFTLLVIVGLIGLTLLWWQSREGNDLFGGGSDDSPIAVDSLDGTSDAAPAADTGTQLAPNSDTALPPMPTAADTPAADNAAVGGDATAAPASDSATPAADEREAQSVATSAQTAAPQGSASAGADAQGTADQGAAGQSAETAAASSDESAQSTPSADVNTLALTFNEQSWTEIYDATDKRIFSGLQSAGSQATARGKPPFRLTIGNASGVSLRYRGQTVDLGQYTGGNNVARFTLGD